MAIGKFTKVGWETTSECNVRGFEVERSTDGRAFEKIGAVAASTGCSAIYRSYSFTDQKLASSTRFYRLRAVDLDGAESFSPIRAVSSNRPSGEVSAFPSETADAFLIQNTAREGVRFFIRDMAGRLVESGSVGAEASVELHASAWHSGIYAVFFEIGGTTEVSRLMKI